MKTTKRIIVVLLILFIQTIPVSAQEKTQEELEFPVLNGPYLGQKPPGMTPEIFAPGILSRDTHEQDPIFSPDGSTVYFTFVNPSREYVTMLMKRENSIWSESYSEGVKVNTKFEERHPCVSQDGTLYFYSDREGSHGEVDIYRSRLIDGEYQVPENLGEPVNTEISEYNPYVSPDERFLRYNTGDRQDSYGSHDLYISFRNDNGTWSEPVNMGKRINTEAGEYKPFVTYDGKYFFFSSSRSGNGDIYWIDAKVIEELRPGKKK
ncbi:hypothetical protein ACFL6G_07650 [candidate division KSB1 bacterium]